MYLGPKGTDRGTLRTNLSGFNAGTYGNRCNHIILKCKSENTIVKPRQRGQQIKYTDLRRISQPGSHNMYALILKFAQTVWTDISIVDDMTFTPGTTPLVASACAVSLPVIFKTGLQFGSLLDNRSEADRFACVDFPQAQVPAKLLYHFELSVPSKQPILCSVVQRMVWDDNIPTMPWSL